MLDVVITGGRVVDGTGSDSRYADVGIQDGRIVEIGAVDSPAKRTVDAAGQVVSPGFIDLHTHLDAQAFWDSSLSPSPLQGVTTVMGGNCGFSIAPLASGHAEYVMRMLARVEGIPLSALEAGVPWDWSTTAEFLSRLEGTLAINAGFMVGHSCIRRMVLGEDATQRVATEDEIKRMMSLVDDGLRAGAFGFSSTWSTAHHDSDGEPVPSRSADANELLALAGRCRNFEGTSLEFLPRAQPRLPLDDESFQAMVGMSRAAQRPLNWNLMRVSAANVNAEEVAGRLRSGLAALDQGARVVALMMPEPLDIRLSFATGVQLDAIQGWRKPMSLGIEEKIAMLTDPAARAGLAELAANDTNRRAMADWSSYTILETFTEFTSRFQGRTVDEIAKETGRTPFDTLVEISLADRLQTLFHQPLPPDSRADWQARATVASDTRVLVGGSDAGAHLDMIGAFNYTTQFIARMVREQQVLPLEQAIHLLTGAPAAFYGLRRRGLIRPGYSADLLILDPDSIGSAPLSTRFDLPGGAGRLYAEGRGIHRVFVNGEVIAVDGKMTDARPGAILRSGRDSANPPLVAA